MTSAKWNETRRTKHQPSGFFGRSSSADAILALCTGHNSMREADLYKELGKLTNNRNSWKENIPFVSSLLASHSSRIQAKALWLLGEFGLAFPCAIKEHVSVIASFLDSTESILRERSVNALGRIGRGCYMFVEPYMEKMIPAASDEAANVRLSFIWASENIAVNTPDPFEIYMPLFAELLHDTDDRVRMEAPEIFRVLGRKNPKYIQPYIGQLLAVSKTDCNRVVRIHCSGAINAAARGTPIPQHPCDVSNDP